MGNRRRGEKDLFPDNILLKLFSQKRYFLKRSKFVVVSPRRRVTASPYPVENGVGKFEE
jgi:hypothetical protein